MCPRTVRTTRWNSFSVAKSITSTLVGAAMKDGYIRSLDDAVTRYISALRGSAYDGVTVRQLLTMTSGVKWNEDYTDVNSDVARMYAQPAEPGFDMTVSYVRKLPREAAPGTKWVYKTVGDESRRRAGGGGDGEAAGGVPVGKNLAPLRHGARRRMDDR